MLLCENEKEIDNDLDKINYWYHKAAEKNNKFALYKLGEFYELGRGVSKNLIRALEFYKASANQECTEAQYKLEYCYDNNEKEFDLYIIAAEKGNSNA